MQHVSGFQMLIYGYLFFFINNDEASAVRFQLNDRHLYTFINVQNYIRKQSVVSVKGALAIVAIGHIGPRQNLKPTILWLMHEL